MVFNGAIAEDVSNMNIQPGEVPPDQNTTMAFERFMLRTEKRNPASPSEVQKFGHRPEKTWGSCHKFVVG